MHQIEDTNEAVPKQPQQHMAFSKMALEDSTENVAGNQIAKDSPELIALLTELKSNLTEVVPNIDALSSRVNSGDISTENGISFLEVKHHLLLDYLVNLVYIILLKVDSKPLSDAPVVERLTEIRTVIEKIRPVDQKLKYQIDKLMKMAVTGSNGSNPLSFKPNPDNLAAKVGGDDDDSDAEESAKTGVYVAPKVSAVPYEDHTWTSRKRKLEERMKQKTLNSSLLKDLRDEYSEAPEEIKDDNKGMKAEKEQEREKERERYEEDHLIRLNVASKDKKAKRESSLKDLTKFEGFGAFDDENGDEGSSRSKSGKKSKSFRKGGKKKFKSKKKKH